MKRYSVGVTLISHTHDKLAVAEFLREAVMQYRKTLSSNHVLTDIVILSINVTEV